MTLASIDDPFVITTVQITPSQLDELKARSAEARVAQSIVLRQLLSSVLRRHDFVFPKRGERALKVQLILSREQLGRVDRFADEYGVSRSEMVRRLLATALFLTNSRG